MSMGLVRFGWIVLFTTPHAVELSTWIGVGGCLCPNSSSRCRIGTASRALMYSAPSSASAADDMTALMIWETVNTAPLFGGSSLSSKQKNVRLLCCVLSFQIGMMHHYVVQVPCRFFCMLQLHLDWMLHNREVV